MRATGLVSITLAIMVLAATDAGAASWCAFYTGKALGGSENCGFATIEQCLAQVRGLGGWCRPNPFPGTAFGTSGTWGSGPSRAVQERLSMAVASRSAGPRQSQGESHPPHAVAWTPQYPVARSSGLPPPSQCNKTTRRLRPVNWTTFDGCSGTATVGTAATLSSAVA